MICDQKSVLGQRGHVRGIENGYHAAYVHGCVRMHLL